MYANQSDAHAPRQARPTREAGGVLTIDLGALVANWRLLQARAGGAECAAVVKADAYGLGIEPVVRALGTAGCRTFFVAAPVRGGGAPGRPAATARSMC